MRGGERTCGGMSGFYGSEREGVRVSLRAHGRQLARGSPTASVNPPDGQKEVLLFVVRKEPPAGSSEGPTAQGHSAFSVHQLSLALARVVRSLKVAIASQLQLVETSCAETKQLQL